MPKSETGKAASEPTPGFPPTGKAIRKSKKESGSSDADLLQSLSNRLSILEEKFDRLVKSHRFMF